MNHAKRLIFAIATAILASVVTAGRASAQPNCCPTYTVTVMATVPAACFPVTVRTFWPGPLVGTSVHNAPGTIVVTAPNPPGCWTPQLIGITVNNVNIPPPTGSCSNPVFIGCGFVTVCAGLDAAGCPTFTVF